MNPTFQEVLFDLKEQGIPITPERICGTVLENENCSVKNGPQVEWKLEVDLGTKPDKISDPSESRVSFTLDIHQGTLWLINPWPMQYLCDTACQFSHYSLSSNIVQKDFNKDVFQFPAHSHFVNRHLLIGWMVGNIPPILHERISYNLQDARIVYTWISAKDQSITYLILLYAICKGLGRI